MSHHKKEKFSKCPCENKQEKKQEKKHERKYERKQERKYERKEHKEYPRCGCLNVPKCEQKYYLPLPATPSQPVNGMKIKTDAWFAPGTVQSSCAICSTVKPVYVNPCNTCRYPPGVNPINNSAYYTTNEYLY